MKTMLVTKIKIVMVLLGLTLCLAGGGLLAYQALAESVAEPPPGSEPREEAEAFHQPGAEARVDCHGDPLPAHALARMGTTRLWRRAAWCRDNAFAFSSDGKTLATHIKGMTVCLWDVTTGKEISRLTAKAIQGDINSLAFSPDGKTLVTVNWDRTVCWWEMATGKLLRKQQYQGPKGRGVRCLQVVFLPGGKMLGFGCFFLKSVDKKGRWISEAYVWDVATGKELCQLNRPLKQGEGEREPTAFSPDGKILATILNDEDKGKISLWDIATGKEIRQLILEDGGVEKVAFSADGKTFATGQIERICVWEVATGKQIHRSSRPALGGALNGPLTYSPDGKTLVGGRSGSLWDMGTGKEIRSFGCSEQGGVAIFSPDGKTLAVGDGGGAIRLWEVDTGKEIGPRKGFRGGIRSVAYSPDGKTLASLGQGEEIVRLWEADTGKEIRQLAKGIRSVRYFALLPDGKMLASTLGDVPCLLDTVTGKEIRRFQRDDGWVPGSPTFSSDGKKLAIRQCTNASTPDVWVWEVDTGRKIFSLSTGNPNSVTKLIAFSPDGRLLATDGEKNTVSLWEVATGERIGQLGLKRPAQPREVFVWFLAFSPDGRLLATSSSGESEGKVRVWEVASGKEIGQLAALKPGFGGGCVLAFSPDGRLLATAAQNVGNGHFDPTVRLWEVASGKEIGQLAGHQDEVRTITFSPDGKTLTSGSNDLTCLVWDVTSFTCRLKPMLGRPLPAQILSKERLETAWADLAKEPAKAYAAIWALQATPAQVIPLLQARLRPVAPLANPQQLKRWIADLDANNFTVRDKARREIEKLGEPAVPALRQALKGQLSVEARRRLKDLLIELEPQEVVVSSNRLRELRAVQVLESIGAAEARQLLQAWAKGLPGARLTVEAEVALARLAKRTTPRP